MLYTTGVMLVPKKRLLYILLFIIFLAISIGGFIYFSNKKQNPESLVQETDFPKRVEVPAPNDLSPVIREESYTYTDEIISPNDISNDPSSYLGRSLASRGWIREVSPNNFLLYSINNEEQFGIKIATNSDINFKDYLDPSNIPGKQSKPVKLAGELSTLDDGVLVFLVTDLTE